MGLFIGLCFLFFCFLGIIYINKDICSLFDYIKNITRRIEPKESNIYPGWYKIDCGCSNGLKWGGEYPIECNRCKGTSYLYFHEHSGILALYPGGPFAGCIKKKTFIEQMSNSETS